jgi:signal transduction histidine kinase
MNPYQAPQSETIRSVSLFGRFIQVVSTLLMLQALCWWGLLVYALATICQQVYLRSQYWGDFVAACAIALILGIMIFFFVWVCLCLYVGLMQYVRNKQEIISGHREEAVGFGTSESDVS